MVWGSQSCFGKIYVDELTQLKWGASLLVAGFVKDEDNDPYPLILKMNQASSEVTARNILERLAKGYP